MRARFLLLGWSGILLAGCGGGDAGEPDPAPRAVEPGSGFAGLATAVRITGDNFLARATGDELDTRHRAWVGGVELGDVAWVDGHTLTATVPGVLSPGVKDLKVQNAYGREGTLTGAFTVVPVPSALVASLAVGRASAGVGQPVNVTLTLKNGGSGPADVTAVTPTHAGPAAACGAVSPQVPVRLAAGASQSFTWACTGTAAGSLALGAAVAATDADSHAPLEVTAGPAAISVQAPASLRAALEVSGAAAVTVGQGVALRLSVADDGGAAAILSSLVVTPADGGCGAPAPATPQTVAGGQSSSFTFTCAPTASGTLAPSVAVQGQDGNTGAQLTATATLAPALTVQAPQALTAAISATPTAVRVGQSVDVTLVVTNGGSGGAATVLGIGPWSTGAGGASCVSVSVPAGTVIAVGAAQRFRWSCTATQAGDLQLGGMISYTAGGASRSASTAVPLAVLVMP